MKQAGFILPFTLLLLTCAMLFSLLQWQHLLHVQRITHGLWKQADTLYHLESVATKLSESLPSLSLHEILEGDTEDHTFHYQARGEGDFPCIRIHTQAHWFSTHHIHLNVWALAHPEHVLSLRIAQPIALQKCPHTQLRIVPHRILSWERTEPW